MARRERTYIEKALETHFRLYEVFDVDIDRRLRLRDLRDNTICAGQERSATHALVRWHLGATRLMEMGTGNWVSGAVIFNYPQIAKGEILRELRRIHRRPHGTLGPDYTMGRSLKPLRRREVAIRPVSPPISRPLCLTPSVPKKAV